MKGKFITESVQTHLTFVLARCIGWNNTIHDVHECNVKAACARDYRAKYHEPFVFYIVKKFYVLYRHKVFYIVKIYSLNRRK